MYVYVVSIFLALFDAKRTEIFEGLLGLTILPWEQTQRSNLFFQSVGLEQTSLVLFSWSSIVMISLNNWLEVNATYSRYWTSTNDSFFYFMLILSSSINGRMVVVFVTSRYCHFIQLIERKPRPFCSRTILVEASHICRDFFQRIVGLRCLVQRSWSLSPFLKPSFFFPR